jgi:hypothetical protein
MCSERGLGIASRERPVDRADTCYCLVPESVHVTLKRIQILSFETSTEGGSNPAEQCPLHTSFRNEEPKAA